MGGSILDFQGHGEGFHLKNQNKKQGGHGEGVTQLTLTLPPYPIWTNSHGIRI